MPYHFNLVHRSGTFGECRSCKKLIQPNQLLHTIVVRWEQELNELDFCQACYTNHLQQYFTFQGSVSSNEQPEILQFLSKLIA